MNKFAKMLITDGRRNYRDREMYPHDGAMYRRDGTYHDGEYYHDGIPHRGKSGRFIKDHNYDYAYDHNAYDYSPYGRMDYAHDYGQHYDMGAYADYGEHKHLFSKRDMEAWKAEMLNDDGSRGEHFRPEQCHQAARSSGIDYERYGDGIFCLAMNMMYSDHCKTGKKYGDRPDFYADLARDFLEDKDFDGTGAEKLYLYYKAIVEKDD